jgi:hypothetical protein
MPRDISGAHKNATVAKSRSSRDRDEPNELSAGAYANKSKRNPKEDEGRMRDFWMMRAHLKANLAVVRIANPNLMKVRDFMVYRPSKYYLKSLSNFVKYYNRYLKLKL